MNVRAGHVQIFGHATHGTVIFVSLIQQLLNFVQLFFLRILVQRFPLHWLSLLLVFHLGFQHTHGADIGFQMVRVELKLWKQGSWVIVHQQQRVKTRGGQFLLLQEGLELKKVQIFILPGLVENRGKFIIKMPDKDIAIGLQKPQFLMQF